MIKLEAALDIIRRLENGDSKGRKEDMTGSKSKYKECSLAQTTFIPKIVTEFSHIFPLFIETRKYGIHGRHFSSIYS